ncbi:hypothetical protein [uncultured Microbacterium sp.]|uniref:hypothetical protein n=1 Tax=uncultured Microbacterium sp. TaxID=191216 RepID=UPI0025D58868|nr:hypothetical protein [uncultured Microbacterium sp.]
MPDADRPPRAPETRAGRHRIPLSCTVHVPHDVEDAALHAFDEALQRAHLRAAPAREARANPGATGETLRVYSRGSFLADTFFNGTGLSLLTTRVGPLSMQAVVVLTTRTVNDLSRVIVSMVVGGEVAPEIAREMDAAIDGLVARGVVVEGPGWARAVDVPRESLGHPRTAREHGIRG